MDPSYVFHVLNAFDDGDRTVLDVVRYDSVFDTGTGRGRSAGSSPSLYRWTVDPAANRVHEEALDDTPVEFPRIDPAVAGCTHRYGYCVRLGADPDRPRFEGLVKYDFARDESVRFDPGEGRARASRSSSGPPTATGEDEGWVLSVVYDATRDASDLVILDATSFAGPPVATVHLPGPGARSGSTAPGIPSPTPDRRLRPPTAGSASAATG